MQVVSIKSQQPKIQVEKISTFKGTDLEDLCDASQSTFEDDVLSFSIGLGNIEASIRDKMESYWRGTLLVPERVLIVGRLDGVIASSIQLVKPAPNNHASNFAGMVENHFVAPWARGYGLAKHLLKVLEHEAENSGLSLLKLSVRSNLKPAIKLYESSGYKHWGTLEKYERIDGKFLSGNFYCKEL